MTVARKPSSDPPRLMRRGAAGQAAAAMAGAAQAKGTGRGRARSTARRTRGAPPADWPRRRHLWRWHEPPARPARGSARMPTGAGRALGCAALGAAVCLGPREVKLCAGSSARRRLPAASPRTWPRSALNRHGHPGALRDACRRYPASRYVTSAPADAGEPWRRGAPVPGNAGPTSRQSCVLPGPGKRRWRSSAGDP